MFEYVKNYGLQFSSSLKKRSKTNLIVLHHSEGGDSETVQSIHNYHLDQGHKGIDYNICIEKNGTVAWGRGLEYDGGHTMNKLFTPTYGVNARSVGIVCLGNFNKKSMSEVQKNALKQVVTDLVKYYGFTSVSQIVSHKEIAGANYTDCPGKYFPTEEIRDCIRNGGYKSNYTYTATKDTPLLQVVRTIKAGETVDLDSYFTGNVLARVEGGQVIFADFKK